MARVYRWIELLLMDMEMIINRKNRTLQPRIYSLVPTILRMAASGGTVVGCPTYTPPAGNSVECNFTMAYTPPAGNNVQLDFCTSQ